MPLASPALCVAAHTAKATLCGCVVPAPIRNDLIDKIPDVEHLKIDSIHIRVCLMEIASVYANQNLNSSISIWRIFIRPLPLVLVDSNWITAVNFEMKIWTCQENENNTFIRQLLRTHFPHGLLESPQVLHTHTRTHIAVIIIHFCETSQWDTQNSKHTIPFDLESRDEDSKVHVYFSFSLLKKS